MPKKWTPSKLRRKGFDGLWNPEIPCGCGVDDFMPCGMHDDEDYEGCEPAYRQYCNYCEVKDCERREDTIRCNGTCYGPIKTRRPSPEGK